MTNEMMTGLHSIAMQAHNGCAAVWLSTLSRLLNMLHLVESGASNAPGLEQKLCLNVSQAHHTLTPRWLLLLLLLSEQSALQPPRLVNPKLEPETLHVRP